MSCTNNRCQPLACTLSPDSFRDRKELIDTLLRRGLAEVTPVPGGVRARLAPGAEIEANLQALVDLEAECCTFLSMTLHLAPDEMVLEVTGPPGARPLIAELFTDRADPDG